MLLRCCLCEHKRLVIKSVLFKTHILLIILNYFAGFLFLSLGGRIKRLRPSLFVAVWPSLDARRLLDVISVWLSHLWGGSKSRVNDHNHTWLPICQFLPNLSRLVSSGWSEYRSHGMDLSTSVFALELWQNFNLWCFCGYFLPKQWSGGCKPCITPLYFITIVISDYLILITIPLKHHMHTPKKFTSKCKTISNYVETQAEHKAIFQALNFCLKLHYTEINMWQNQRFPHTNLTFTLGLAQRCTVTAEQSWGHKVFQGFVGSYLN